MAAPWFNVPDQNTSCGGLETLTGHRRNTSRQALRVFLWGQARFNVGPMTSDQLEPLFWRRILGLETADVVACLLRALAGALLGPPTPDNHQAAGEWKIHRHAIGGEGVDG